MKDRIIQNISTECPWRDTLYWYDTTDSTNLRLRQLAKTGAPQGTVVVAGAQSGGRGRLGRSFSSPRGQGVYLSALLRPGCKPEKMMHLTCAVGVAMVQAVERACGVRPGIKWTNDLVFEKRKLGGILTELAVDGKTGLVDYVVVGIGINCRQKKGDFPAELQDVAASLSMICGKDVDTAQLAGAMIEELARMADELFTQKKAMMAAYRESCVTLGQQIVLLRGEQTRYGKALDLDEDGGLVVEFADGLVETVSSGEVSVRGMYGYI